jgi:GT2 family glycosyltransferase
MTSVVIVSYNSADYLPQCLDSLRRSLAGSAFEVIVVDNNSQDRTLAVLEREEGITLIKNKENRGFARAANQGLGLARGEYLLLLNPDTVVEPNSIRLLQQCLDQNFGIGIVGPKELDGQGRTRLSLAALFVLGGSGHLVDRYFPRGSCWRRVFPVRPKNVWVLHGFCLFLRRKMMEQIGLLDEDFFLYGEEVEYCHRARKAGWQVYYLPEVEVRHYAGASARKNWLRNFLLSIKYQLLCLKKL